MKAVIHATRIKWQDRYYNYFKQGFEAHGISVERTSFDKPMPGDIHVLFGPNYWKDCEQKYENYLQVNRKFIGNVHDDVAVSWNGFNGRGIFNVWNPTGEYLERVLARSPIKIHPWRGYDPDSFLLLGQADIGRAKTWAQLSDWYQAMRHQYDSNPTFREHPIGNGHSLQQDVARTGFSVSLNSTVAVETLMLGHPTMVWDQGSPVWSLCGPWDAYGNMTKEPNRAALFEYLANCQYHYSDIVGGYFWKQLGPGPKGPRLCDVKF